MKIHKSLTNLEIAELLRNMAAAYQLKDEKKNRFRIVAYQRAADAVEHLSSEAKDLWDEGKLKDVAGIGVSIAKHLDEVFKKGKSPHFESVLSGIPPSTFEMMKVPGIGPKTAIKMAKELGIEDKNALGKLEKAAKEGRVGQLEGMGEESEKAILKAIKETKGRKRRLLLNYASRIADEILAWMKKSDKTARVDALGSLRRHASSVGDIDIAVATKDHETSLKHFSQYPKAKRVLEKGEHTASILLPGDIQVDLMVQPPEAYGSLLQHFTGSKHHNIALREEARKKGLSLSEYGIKEKGKLKKTETEEEFYRVLGMDWISPELREDMGEIEAAKEGRLPKLVELEEIKGDLQIHSSFDIETSHDLGESSMEEIISKASDLGYEYLAFTEHNPSKGGHSDNQVLELLKRKQEKIETINLKLSEGKSYSGVKTGKTCIKKVYNSLEIDILPDGKLPLSEEALSLLDFALVSVHSSFRLGRDEMTKRVLTGLNHPKVKILAHPTARKINEREGVELNWPEIFAFCLKNDKWLEINADPMRLDLPDFLVKEAVEQGVKITLGTDSHHQDSLDNMIYGVYVARRGWAKSVDIVNTLSFDKFQKLVE